MASAIQAMLPNRCCSTSRNAEGPVSLKSLSPIFAMSSDFVASKSYTYYLGEPSADRDNAIFKLDRIF